MIKIKQMDKKKFIIIFITLSLIIPMTLVSSEINILSNDIGPDRNIITISKSALSIQDITDGIGFKILFSNHGTSKINNIHISIEIDNVRLIFPKYKEFTIDEIKPDETISKRISFFGLNLGLFSDIPEINIYHQDSSEILLGKASFKIHGFFTTITQKYIKDDNSFVGYTIYTPEYSGDTYIINQNGSIVHTWESDNIQGMRVELLENGNLLRVEAPKINPRFAAGGFTGLIKEVDWNGTIIWEYEHSTQNYCIHHDFERLPNGNILLISWEYKTGTEAIEKGRNPQTIQLNQVWPDYIIEIQPNKQKGAEIVWEWHAWDHLIQDYDPNKENYGSIADHPERIDVNYGVNDPDWLHTNSIDYNEEYDQILLSVRNFNEIWVIDHSTTTQEAQGHTGGRYGKGGDLLYRWGNPQAYDTGDERDRKLFHQHDANWIEKDHPGEGNILVFNNRRVNEDGEYSTVDELTPPIDDSGNYKYLQGKAFGPKRLTWTYEANPKQNFYAHFLSGAQRLPNGNTLICDGPEGYIFEVTEKKEKVWEFTHFFHNGFQGEVVNAEKYSPDYPGLINLS